MLSSQKFVTLSVGTPQCPYGITYRKAYGLLASELFNKSLFNPPACPPTAIAFEPINWTTAMFDRCPRPRVSRAPVLFRVQVCRVETFSEMVLISSAMVKRLLSNDANAGSRSCHAPTSSAPHPIHRYVHCACTNQLSTLPEPIA